MATIKKAPKSEYVALGKADRAEGVEVAEQVLENIREHFGANSSEALAYAKGAGL